MNFGKGLTGLRIDFYTDFLLTGNIKETVAGSATVSSFLLSYIHHHRQRFIAGGEKLYPQALVILFRGARIYRQGKQRIFGCKSPISPSGV